jgi:hypothetical protein
MGARETTTPALDWRGERRRRLRSTGAARDDDACARLARRDTTTPALDWRGEIRRRRLARAGVTDEAADILLLESTLPAGPEARGAAHVACSRILLPPPLFSSSSSRGRRTASKTNVREDRGVETATTMTTRYRKQRAGRPMCAATAHLPRRGGRRRRRPREGENCCACWHGGDRLRRIAPP